ncbi:hypothetical protein [Streptosporangium vulgare]|uniref:hypothetical protein n=1 Tax=Streptosporangium vulgare TaxID=46190 RepID=UPI0031D522E4
MVSGDVTGADSVAAAAAGHDAAVNAAARLDVSATDFYLASTTALLDGLARAGVGRLVGDRYRHHPGDRAGGASLQHARLPRRGTRLLPGTRGGTRRPARGGHRDRLGGARPTRGPPGREGRAHRPVPDRRHPAAVRRRERAPVSYADLAVAVVDEIETPKHHRALVAVSY